MISGRVKNKMLSESQRQICLQRMHILKKNFANIMTIISIHFTFLFEMKEPCPFSSNLDAHPCSYTDKV